MGSNTFSKFKKYMIIFSVVILLIIFILLLIFTKDNNLIRNLKEFIEKDTKVLYISDSVNYSKYPQNILKKYDVQYMYIDSTDLDKIEQSKIKKIVNSTELSNIIIIYKDGKLLDAIIDYRDENSLNSFFQKYEVIPLVIGNIDNIFESIDKSLARDNKLLYLPYNFVDGIDEQNRILRDICKQYNIEYEMVNTYLLSKIQQEKLNAILQVSSVEDQIIILIKDKKIIGSIRGINNKSAYLDKIYNYKFIENINDTIVNINYITLNELLSSNSKNVILITKDDCKYCSETRNLLNKISINYGINIMNINVKDFNDDISHKIENSLLELGYLDGFTTPLTVVTESGKLVDYVIGLSSEDYFVEKFTESGIIK